MALNCLFRNAQKTLPVTAKFYVGGNSVKSLPSVFFKSGLTQNAGFSTLRFLPACASKAPSSLNYQQVKEFSVSPKSLAAAGDHSKLWSAERILSASLLGIVPLAFIYPNAGLDTVLAVAGVMHNHWGIEAIVVDYVRPIIFGPVIPKIALGLTYAFSTAILVGLFYLIFSGPGLVNTIQMLWKL